MARASRDQGRAVSLATANISNSVFDSRRDRTDPQPYHRVSPSLAGGAATLQVLRFLGLEAPGGARECGTCFDTVLACEGLSCASAHFTCGSCLGREICRQAERVGEGRGDRPGPVDIMAVRCVDPVGCQAQPFSDAELARVLPADAVSGCLRASLDARAAVQGVALAAGFQRERLELLRRLGEAEARAGNLGQLRESVVETILTTRCPNPACMQRFGGFTGCFALQCKMPDDAAGAWGGNAAAFCGRAFCGWCFEPCGADAHAHVRNCPSKLSNDAYYGTDQQYNESLRRLQLRRLQEYSSTLDAGVWRDLKQFMRDDWARHGLAVAF